jgi:hypothetical protein
MLNKVSVVPLMLGFIFSNASCQGAGGNTLSPNAYLSANNYVQDAVNHGAFSGFGELLLPRDNNASYYNTRLSNVASLMPYHQNVNPADVVNALNGMIDEVNAGNTIF